jgi:hypothetical protein
MDDKVFASANMTVAMSDDPTEYESIPTVNVFDSDFTSIGTTNAISAGHKGRSGRFGWRALVILPAIAGAYLLLASCQGGGY